MTDAKETDPENYTSFNQFFTRALRPETRPIGEDIISPADGVISEIGDISHQTLIQAKNHYFKLADLVGDVKTAKLFENGKFVTIYLAPKDYHRVHMPLTGYFKNSLYIPGKLFSVNHATAQVVPNLFSRNERIVTLFDDFAVILVGAMIVGNIVLSAHENTVLQKADELGYFQLGSTVIMLFQANQIHWHSHIIQGTPVKMGQSIGAKNRI